MFVFLVDMMIGKEDQLVIANLSQLMALKTEEPIFYAKGWFNIHISIMVTRL